MTLKVVYVDVDDTLVRSMGSKRIPMGLAIDKVKRMAAEGHILYLWSRGGGAYAESTAHELGIAPLFAGFLPKPDLLVDDQPIEEWTHLQQERPY